MGIGDGDDFRGTGRFLIQRRVRSGGMGVVYLAHDQERNEVVAIKTLKALHGVDGDGLYRLRNEFRSRAELVHPNLINLYELFVEGDRWFFTMEFVRGVDLLDYVRTGPSADAGEWPSAAHASRQAIDAAEGNSADLARDSRSPDTTVGQAIATAPIPGQACHETATYSPCSADSLARLRAAFRQLAEGLEALQGGGLLHRDVKPSNVLVTSAGRVVLLDFGLAIERERAEREDVSTQCVVGTISYMSPEQAHQARLTPASDWYSVGVMLFEALTGRLPIEGRGVGLLQRKQEVESPAPRELTPDVPDDLNTLCVDLLRRDPAARPTGAEVLRRLQTAGETERPGPPAPHFPAVSRTPFIGRGAHLQTLSGALQLVRQGRTAVVYVSGSSGVGKTALVHEFLHQIDDGEESVLLQGKCHERESIPYKALDTIAESLARYLVRLPRHDVEALLPRDVVALARVFPILRRVEAIAEARPRETETSDQQEIRQRAFNGLRELLARLGDRRTLILHIDDLQWGDMDSVALLRDLLRPPDPPILLLLLSYRSEDRATSPVLKAMLGPQGVVSSGVETRELAVGPLTPEESTELARRLLAGEESDADGVSDMIARESGGNPYFVDALVRHYQAAGQDAAAGRPAPAVSLDDVLWQRAEQLPEAARRLLRLVAVAGHPLRQIDACEATAFMGERHETLAVLRSVHLVRSRGEGLEDAIETYHDRVREAIIRHLPTEVVINCHRALARALESSGQADHAELATHFAAAGENDRAAVHYIAAAGQAAKALAFDYAVGLYELAFDLQPPVGPEASELRSRLGDALANAGRGVEAAEVYLTAAAGAEADQSVELRRRAAMQFLVTGHIESGVTVLREVLAAMGMKLPTGPKMALLSFLLRRFLLWVRGLDFREREAGKIPQKDLAKIDTCWSAGVGLVLVDPIRGADFQTRGLLLALRAGEPYRIARSLALNTMNVAMEGTPAAGRVKRLLDKSRDLARRIDSPHVTGLAAAAEGIVACLAGNWKRGVECCSQANQNLRDHGTGVWWDRFATEGFALSALFYSGHVAELARRLPEALNAVRNRGDLLCWSRLGTIFLPALAADNAAEAQRELDLCMSPWPEARSPVQDFNKCYAELHIFLYRGDVLAAWQRVMKKACVIRRSLILHAQLARGLFYDVRGRCALAATSGGNDHRLFVRAAERDARRLERERMPWMDPLANRIRAGVAALRGNMREAATFLRSAVEGFDAAGMPLHAAVSRRRLGELLAGQEGRDLIEKADAWMARQGVKNPPRMTALYAPGFGGQINTSD